MKVMKVNGVKIREDAPRRAVYYWLYCNGGADYVEVRINGKKNKTTFINKFGRKLEFGYCLRFTSDKNVYGMKSFISSGKDLCKGIGIWR